MGRQRDNASAGFIWKSEEVAVWIHNVSGGVQTIRRLDSIENPIPIVVNYTLNG